MTVFLGYMLSMAAQTTNPFTDTLTSENISNTTVSVGVRLAHMQEM